MKKIITCWAIFLFLLTGCGALPVEQPILLPPLPDAPLPQLYATAVVTRGDVLRFSNTSAVMIPFAEEDLHFGAGSHIITGIFAQVGDFVNAGDIIATISRPYILERKESFSREEEWLHLHLRQLEERRQFTLETARLLNEPTDDSAYLTSRANLLNQLDINSQRLEQLQYEYNNQFLRSSINGIITQVLEYTPGLRVTDFQIVAEVMDPLNFIFRVRGDEIRYMISGDEHDMTVNGEPFRGVVIDPNEYGYEEIWAGIGVTAHDAFIRIISETQPIISVMNFATVHLVMEEARDVLHVPNLAVRHVGERSFVYVLEEDVRILRYVEIGIIGNAFTEITEGLDEGEIVING